MAVVSACIIYSPNYLGCQALLKFFFHQHPGLQWPLFFTTKTTSSLTSGNGEWRKVGAPSLTHRVHVFG